MRPRGRLGPLRRRDRAISPRRSPQPGMRRGYASPAGPRGTAASWPGAPARPDRSRSGDAGDGTASRPGCRRAVGVPRPAGLTAPRRRVPDRPSGGSGCRVLRVAGPPVRCPWRRYGAGGRRPQSIFPEISNKPWTIAILPHRPASGMRPRPPLRHQWVRSGPERRGWESPPADRSVRRVRSRRRASVVMAGSVKRSAGRLSRQSSGPGRAMVRPTE